MSYIQYFASFIFLAFHFDDQPIRNLQTWHHPIQPRSNVSVLVTAQIGQGISKAILKLQSVGPGKYIRKSDPSYEKEWIDMPMRDDGKEGDVKAGDGIFSINVPANYQRHRWLMRYRIIATDVSGKITQSPPPDDTCPNYAWYCDNGPAEWIGTRDPGKTLPLKFSPDFLNTLQSLILIALQTDVARSQWDGNFHKQKQQGTFVYKGVVYDHIQLNNRGQGSAHIGGKNKWGLKFNKGHDVPIQNHDGSPFPHTCDSLNLNPGGSTPYIPVLRGISGLDEVLSMRAYRLAGVPSPQATWVQWRIVDNTEEVSIKDQFEGDLWGLYVAIGDMEPKLLADSKLPDGLSVSIQSGIKHTPRDLTDAPKEWEKFLNGMRSNPNEAWWRTNLNLPAFFSFHAMNRLLGNVDLRPDGNHGYYRNPDGHWAPIPWDNDMMFVPRHHQPGIIDAMACLNHPKIALEYRNRAREILDLFASDNTDNGGQVGQLTSDLAKALTPKGYLVDWSKLDESMWNQHPRMNQKGSYFVNPCGADHFGGPWKRTLTTNDFNGFRKYLIDFCTDSRPNKSYAPNDGDQRGYGWGYLSHEAKDQKIPGTATLKRAEGAQFIFTASAFVSPLGHKPAVLECRVGRLGKLGWYELQELWRNNQESGTNFNIPPEIFMEQGRYRIRVRWCDDTGRCGHWSSPVELNSEAK